MEKISQFFSPSTTPGGTDNRKRVQKKSSRQFASQWLKYSAMFWFVVVMAGQWFFFYYIFAFYGASVISDNMEIWNRWEPMGSTPYKAGDFGGNLAFAAHALGAGIVAFGGALQLIPIVRSRFPRFHKINGYIYLTTVLGLALSGFYLVWIRGTSPNTMSAIGTTINGFLILGFAFMALRCVRNRDISHHRKWAMRLFLVSNAQWFLRVGVFSYMLCSSMLGIKPNFQEDWFFPMWTFGCFLLPLAALQLYFYASEKGSARMKYFTSASVFVLTVFMLAGIVAFVPFLQVLISGGTLG